MKREITPVSDELFTTETGLEFLEEELVQVTEEEANELFGSNLTVVDFFPTYLKYGVCREYPLLYFRSEEIETPEAKYIKYKLSNKGNEALLAFKVEKEETYESIPMPPVSKGRLLIPILPYQFEKKFKVVMSETDGPVSKVPKDVLYNLLYGAPDLAPFVGEEDLKILRRHDFQDLYILPVMTHENLVIERFILTTPVKRIVIGGFRETGN